MEKKVAKFEIKELLGFGFTMIVLGIGLAYGLDIMGDVKGDMTSGTVEYAAVDNATTAVAKIPEKLGTVVTIVMAAVVIGVLIRYLWVRF